MSKPFFTEDPQRCRDPIVAGIFYPEETEELKAIVDRAIGDAGRSRMNALAVVAPHAGYAYVGSLQAKALSCARSRRIENIVILAPRHRETELAVYLPESSIFTTPLGQVKVNQALLAEIGSCGTLFSFDDIPHLAEHSIELQLPFIQRLYPDAKICPLILGSSQSATVQAVASALDVVFSERLDSTLFIVSSNLASMKDPAAARDASIRFIKDAERLNARALSAYSEARAGAICGAHCLAALCATSFMKKRKLEVLSIEDSKAIDGAQPESDISGFQEGDNFEENAVVYAAMAYY